jgi:hypothetical protein
VCEHWHNEFKEFKFELTLEFNDVYIGGLFIKRWYIKIYDIG